MRTTVCDNKSPNTEFARDVLENKLNLNNQIQILESNLLNIIKDVIAKEDPWLKQYLKINGLELALILK